MTPQELKNSILQLAIQGKLVEQRPEEGTAAELPQKIFAAKKNLTRSRGGAENMSGGSRSRATGSRAACRASSVPDVSVVPSVPDDEKPFDIPESWEWVRLGECSTYADKKEKVLPSEIRPDDWSLDLEDIEKETGRIVEFRSAGDRRITGDKVVFRKGQILYSKLRPYLKKILVAPKDGICTPELVPFSALGGIDANYLVIVLKSPHVDFAINSVTYGVKMPRVGTDTMVSLPIPLPPLAEQKRIVAKIEELLPLIDRYEKAWSKLEDFNRRFPVDMQKSVLQMAIQGKLVDQRPEEGTGEELYRQIQLEKQRLIKSGKIKKEKPLPEITDDEKPFDIPEGWVWVRLAEVSKRITDGEHKTPRRVSDYCGYYLLSARNIRDGSILLSDVDYVDKEEYETISKRCNPKRGDILVSCSGSVGRCTVVNDDNNYVMVRSAAMISPVAVDSAYMMFALQSECVQEQIRDKTKQTAQANLFQEAIRSLTIPLPPLAEQKRIVAKLKEILPLCERLK